MTPSQTESRAPVFVLGTPRSGTTLTAKILGRHPRLFMPGETHYFDDVYARRKELGDDFGPECRKAVLDRLATLYGRFNEPPDQKRVQLLMENGELPKSAEGWRSYRDALSGFMEAQMRHEGKERWGNNAPRDIFNVPDILDFYPDARIVVCVRDVRDFLLSYKGKWRSTAADEVERLKKLYHPLVTSLLWKSSMKLLPSIKERVPPQHLFICRYEELVTTPEDTARALCEAVGEEFAPEMLEVESYGSAHGNTNRGVFSTSVGRWREMLAPEEIWAAQMICGEEMRQLGYEPAPVSPEALARVKVVAGFPVALAKGLHANRHKRGPLLPYLAKRVGAMIAKRGA